MTDIETYIEMLSRATIPFKRGDSLHGETVCTEQGNEGFIVEAVFSPSGKLMDIDGGIWE